MTYIAALACGLVFITVLWMAYCWREGREK